MMSATSKMSITELTDIGGHGVANISPILKLPEISRTQAHCNLLFRDSILRNGAPGYA
jgi:hypothetical protein